MNQTTTEQQLARQLLAKKDSYRITRQRDRLAHALSIAVVGLLAVSPPVLDRLYGYDLLETALGVVTFFAVIISLPVATTMLTQIQPRNGTRSYLLAVFGCCATTLFLVIMPTNYLHFEPNPQDPIPIALVVEAILVTASPAFFVALRILRTR